MYRPGTGEWSIEDITSGVVWGGSEGDVPVPGDYDGDGAADLTVSRQRKGKTWWWISYSSRPRGYSNFPAQTGDIVVSGATAY